MSTATKLALTAAIALAAAACSDDSDTSNGPPAASTTEQASSPSTTAAPTTTTTTPAPPPIAAPTDVVDVSGLGAGTAAPLGTPALPDGYVESEWSFGGQATSYEAVGVLPADGAWSVVEADRADYRSRMIVRTPAADQFSGVVIVEWFNVTAGADSGPDWAFLSEEIVREGHAYVGVSAQAVGVNGTAEDRTGGLVDTRGLAEKDPVRYADATHPGDAFSFDVFSQAGLVVRGGAVDVLGGLSPTTVIAAGQSQSAIYLTTYVNAVHPRARVYDGFLVHSRGGTAPLPDGARDGDASAVPIRTDLDEPTFIYAAETDLTLLGYAAARQDNDDSVHTWEVAGTAHSDAFTLGVSAGSPRDAGLGQLIGCPTDINDGPHHETLQAALHHLVVWVTEGTEPPESPRIEVTDADGETTIVRDNDGIAVGGIRTPPVDVPLRVLSGDPSGDEGGFCRLFGQSLPLDLDGRYPSLAEFAATTEASAADAVEAGWLLPADAATIVAEETARAETLGLG